MYTTFRKYNNREAALQVAEFLKSKGIELETSDSLGEFDVSMAYNEVGKEYYVNLKAADFQKAEQLLLDETKQHLDEIGKEYYLFDFSNKELMQVILNPEEWNQLDVLLSQKILKERGIETPLAWTEVVKEEKAKQLYQPEKSSKTWISVGYLLALLGGPAGTVIGFHLMTHKKPLPNGESIYAFTTEDRKHGAIIFSLGLGILVIMLSFYLNVWG